MRSLLFFTLTLTLFNGAAQPGNQLLAASAPFFIPVETNYYYQLGDRKIKISQLQYGQKSPFICLNLHDNEETSVKAAKVVLQTTGGILLKIENNRQRIIKFRLNGITFAFDPNRMFSKTGIQQTLGDNRRSNVAATKVIEGFAKFMLSLIPDSTQCIVALHNNTEEMFSVKSYLPGGNRQRDARAVYVDAAQDVDDIALTTDSSIYQQMADGGYNSIWQDNINAKKDGSLSIYCGENNIRYINIETQHGRIEQYREMLNRLISLWTKETPAMQNEPQTTGLG